MPSTQICSLDLVEFKRRKNISIENLRNVLVVANLVVAQLFSACDLHVLKILCGPL